MQSSHRLFVPTGVYPPDIGGPATYVPLLEKHLAAQGWSVDVLPFSAVRHLPKGIAHIAYFFKALKGARRCDCVYAQDAVSVGWPSLLAAKIARKPFTVKIVGDHVWEQGRLRFGVKEELDNFPFWPLHPYLIFLRILQQAVVRSSVKVVVPSAYLKHMVVGWGISPERVAVIYNGIEIPVLTEEPTVKIERPLIVSVGRLVSWKGFEGVIQALRNEPSWHLAIVGDGPLRANLESFVRQNGMNERVRFTGTLSRKKLHGWLKASDVFVLNSTYEGLPHVLIEAMSIGTPVIASDIAGNRKDVQRRRGRTVLSACAGARKSIRHRTDRHGPRTAFEISMRTVTFSTDRSILDPDSAAAKRKQAYAERS